MRKMSQDEMLAYFNQQFDSLDQGLAGFVRIFQAVSSTLRIQLSEIAEHVPVAGAAAPPPAEIAARDEALRSAQDDLDRMRGEHRALLADRDRLDEEVRRARAEAASSGASGSRVASLEAEALRLQDAVELAKVDAFNAWEKMGSLESAVQQARSEASSQATVYDQQIARLVAERDAALSDREDAMHRLAGAEQNAADATGGMHEQVLGLQAELQEREEVVAALRQELASLVGRLSDLERASGARAGDPDAAAHIGELEVELVTVRDALELSKADAFNAWEKMGSLEIALQDERGRADEERRALLAKLDALQRERDAAVAQSESAPSPAHASDSGAQARIASLEVELVTVRDALELSKADAFNAWEKMGGLEVALQEEKSRAAQGGSTAPAAIAPVQDRPSMPPAFLGAIAARLEQVVGPAARGMCFSAGRTVGERMAATAAKRTDLAEAFAETKKVLDQNGCLWTFEADGGPRFEPDVAGDVKIVFRDCVARNLLAASDLKLGGPLCFMMCGLFSGIFDAVSGKRSKLEVVEAGESACREVLRVRPGVA